MLQKALKRKVSTVQPSHSIGTCKFLQAKMPHKAKTIVGSMCDANLCNLCCLNAVGMAGGLRAAGPKADLALIVADADAVAAGVFTTNVMCAAPVLYCKQVLAKNKPARAVSITVAVSLSYNNSGSTFKTAQATNGTYHYSEAASHFCTIS